MKKLRLHHHKNTLIAVVLILALSAWPLQSASADVCTSTGTGNWSVPATWSCGHVPIASDDVMISNGTTVTFDAASATINSLTINDGNANSSLVIAGTNALTVTNDVQAINTTSLTTKSMDVGAGTLNIGGSLNLSAGAGTRVAQLTLGTGTVTVTGNINNVNVSASSRIIFSGAGVLNVGGNYQNGGTLTPGTGTVNYTGAAQSVGSYIYRNLGLSGSGVKTLQAGTTSVTGNLILSGTASATTAANLAVGGSLNVGSGNSMATGANFTLGVTGPTTIDGSLTLAGTGTKTFTGNVSVNSGGTYNESGVAAINYAGSLTNNGTYTPSTGLHTFTGAARTIAGANLISIPNATFTAAYTNTGALTVGTLLTVTGAGVVLTNNGTLTAGTALSGTGGVTQGAAATLNLGGTSGITALTASAAGNTVNYTGAAQTVKAATYAYLVLGGSGVKSLLAATTVNSNLNILHAGGATASIAAGQTLNVNSLALDGSGQAQGTWGGTGSGATNINPTYFAATTGRLNVAVNDVRAVPVITFGAAPAPTYLGGPFNVSATTTNTDSSALIYSVVSGPCVLVGAATFNSTGAGACVVMATGNATANFEAAANTQSITIAQASQAALTVLANPSTVVQGYSSTLSSSGGSGTGALTYSAGSSTGCNVVGTTLSITDASGTCSVTATKAADANFLAATSAELPITLAPYQAEINKSFSSGSNTILPATVVQLSITIYNPNLFQLTAASWSDDLAGDQPGIHLTSPLNVSTNTCGGNINALGGGTTISLSDGTVPAKLGSTNGSCTVTVDVTSTTPGNLINTIPAGNLNATGNGGGRVANTSPASATLQVKTVLPPSVNMNFNPATIFAGANSQLTINIVSNDPNNPLTQLSLTNLLPANLFISTPAAASLTNCGTGSLTANPGAGSVTLTNATLGSGVGTTCTIRVNITSSTQGAYINLIPAGSIQTLEGVTNAGLCTAPLNVQQLNLTKGFAKSPIAAGSSTLATITLQNPTSVDYTNLSLSDPLPAGMTVVASPAPATTCGSGIVAYDPVLNQVTLTGGTLLGAAAPPAPRTCTITFTVTTPLTMGNTNLTNTILAGSLHDDQNISNPASVSATLAVTGALAVSKSFSPTVITVGNPSTVTITLSNATGTAITGVSMTDSLPTNLVLYSTPALATTCGPGIVTADTVSTPNTVTLTNGTIPLATNSPGTPGTCTVTFRVTSTTSTTYLNQIPSGLSGACGFQASQQICNQSTSNSASLNVQASALPVTGSKTFNPASIAAGTNTLLTINVVAPIDTSLSSVTITDNLLPIGVTISNRNTSNVLTPATKSAGCQGGTLTAITNASTISWVGPLNPATSISAGATCTLSVWVTSNTSGTFTNSVGITDITDFEGRTLTGPFTASLNVSTLQISKAFYPNTIDTNGSSTLTITLTNTNTSALTSLSVNDALPANLVVAAVPNASSSCGGAVSATAGAATIGLTNGTVPAQVGIIAGICTIQVDVKGIGPAGTRTNTIRIAPQDVSAYLGAVQVYPVARAQAILTITPLSITVNKDFAPRTVTGGSVSTMSVTLTNPNNAILTGITFTDSMPAGMIIASPANLSTGTCESSITGGLVPSVLTATGPSSFKFSNGTLPGNGTCTLTLSVTTIVNGNLTNVIPIGGVTSFNGASNPLPTEASLTNLPGASVSKSFAPNPILPGSVSTLTITILNTGSTPLTNIGLSDTLPAGVTVDSSPLPVTTCNNDTWVGLVTVTPDRQTIRLVTGGVPASSSCTITVPVTSSLAGCHLNTIPLDTLTDTEGASNSEDAIDSLCVLDTPSLTTTPSTSTGTVGISLNDTASLTGGNSPTGPVTFKLYPPSDPTCSLTPAHTETINSAPYATAIGFVSNVAGVWHWTADYSGDANNAPASSGCSAEPVTINPASPTITTTASPSTGTVGIAALTGDSATLLNAFNPTGSVTFTLYSDPTCSTPVPGMSGSGSITSGLASWSQSWTPTAAGTYYWLASYPGDANNNAYTTTCGEANEQIVIGTGTPLLTTTASGPVTVGNNITDTAHLSGGYGTLGGSISFDVYGPGDTLCATPLTAPSGATVTGAGDYTSGNFLTSSTGIYRWKAHYSGDANNAAIDTACDEAGETSTVNPASPTITTTASPTSGTVGAAALTGDSATLLNAYNPTGSVTFTLYSDPTCSTPVPGMSGSGSITSGSASWSTSWTPGAGGTYYWLANYPGDANNNAYTTTCGETDEQITVSALAYLGDFVWNDSNANGIQDSGETGISGVTVNLLDSTGTSILQTTATDSNGIYNFTVAPGSYIVQFIRPAGYSASPQYQGGDTTKDSNANTTTGLTETITLVAGENNLTIDAGMFLPTPVLGLTKTDNLNPARYDHVGQLVTYTLTATNIGNMTLHNVTVSDNPALDGFDCTPASPAASLVPGASIICTGTHSITQADLDAGKFDDTASATSTEVEAKDATDEILPAQNAVLGLTKTDDLNPAKFDHVGQLVTYTLTATNDGNVTLHNVTVSDNPALAGFGCTPASPAASLAPGASIVCTGTHSITQADLDAGKFDDTASATSNEADAKDASDTVVASQTPDLSIFKTDGVTSYLAGGVTIYTVTVRNVGNMGVIGARVADAKPANILTWVWACTGQNGGASGCTPAASGSSDFSDTLDLPAGGSIVYTVTANIVTIPTGTLVNTATVTLPEGYTDPTPANNTSTDTDTLSVDLNIVKTDGVSNYSAGGNLTYTVTVRNVGKVDVTGATVTDAKPANILNWAWACTSQNGGATGCTPATIGSADFSDTVNLPMGSSIVYTAFANIVANPSGDLINLAAVAVPAGYSDPTPDNNSSTDKDISYVGSDSLPDRLPDTGFAPNRITKLPRQSISYADLGDLWLEIPALGVKIPIVGVPQTNGSWDVSWLGGQAGWLNGTAYPTSSGDSILTGHVYDAYGQPGPFMHLNWLWYGQQIIVHAGNVQYVYEVREVLQVAPGAVSSVIKHEDLPWVTLITCRGYNEATDSYKYRVAVRAVLVEVK